MRLFVAVVLLLCAACIPKRVNWREVDARADHSTLRHTPAGDVIGFVEQDGTLAWLGLPYAQPPVGPLRWRAPRPVAKFEAALAFSATKYGPQCPQLDAAGAFTGDEACLTLNVSARSIDDSKRPVMVWLHGGGNSIGTANSYVLRNLARRYGVVVVSVNYRLGVLGWFRHPSLTSALDTPADASGNFGTLDVIEALKWVRTNITSFGGDPDNVTVFGESAGGSNVFALLASPLATGLYQRAAIQSGLPSSNTLAEATNFIDDAAPGLTNSANEVLLQQLMSDGKAADRASAKPLLEKIAPPDVANYLRSRTAEQLLTPLQGAPLGMYEAPQLLRDGHVLPTGPIIEALARGPRVPVLLGTHRDEFKRFAQGDKDEAARFPGFSVPYEPAFVRDMQLLSALWKERGADAPAAALQPNAWLYRFDWNQERSVTFAELPQALSTTYGTDVGFVLGDEAGELDVFNLATPESERGRVKLSRAMVSYWVQFAKTGAPGRGVENDLPLWEPSGEGHRFMVFDDSLRMEQGREPLESIEARLWNDASFSSDAERCKTAYKLFKVVGAGTPQRCSRGN